MKKVKIMFPILSVVTIVTAITPLVAITSCSNSDDGEWFGLEMWTPDPSKKIKLSPLEKKWGLADEDAQRLYINEVSANPSIFMDDYHYSSSHTIVNLNSKLLIDLKTRIKQATIDKEKNTVSFEVGFKCTKEAKYTRNTTFGGNYEITMKVSNLPLMINYSYPIQKFIFGATAYQLESNSQWKIECNAMGKAQYYDSKKDITENVDLNSSTVTFDSNKLRVKNTWALNETFLYDLFLTIFPTINHQTPKDDIAYFEGGNSSFFLSSAQPTIYLLPTEQRKIELPIDQKVKWLFPIEANPKIKTAKKIKSGYFGTHFFMESSKDIQWDYSQGDLVVLKFGDFDYAINRYPITFNFYPSFTPSTKSKIKIYLIKMIEIYDMDETKLYSPSINFSYEHPIEISFVE